MDTDANNRAVCKGKKRIGCKISLASERTVSPYTKAPMAADPKEKKMLGKNRFRTNVVIEKKSTLKKNIQKNKIGICKEKIRSAVKQIFANKIAQRELREQSKISRALASCSVVNILLMQSAATNSIIAHRQPICTSGRLITCVPREKGNKIKRQRANIMMPIQKDFLIQKDRTLTVKTREKILNQLSMTKPLL